MARYLSPSARLRGPGSVPRGDVPELLALVRRLFHRLAELADDLHRDLGVNASERAVLEALASGGPQQVPALARAKRVSRQHIQVIVNGLLADGRVESVENPAHLRSPLVRLSRRGEGLFAAIREREKPVIAALARKLSREDVAAAVAGLRELERALDARAEAASEKGNLR